MICQICNSTPQAISIDNVQQHIKGRNDIETHCIRQRQRYDTQISLDDQITWELRLQHINARLSEIQPNDSLGSMSMPEIQPDTSTRSNVKHRAFRQIGEPIVVQRQLNLAHARLILQFQEAR